MTPDETGELPVIEHQDLGVHVFAATREAPHEDLVMLWTEYAEAHDADLTDADLGRALRTFMTTTTEDAPTAS